MNAPSHAIINLALLGRPAKPQFNLAIALGGIVPDLPIFVFYVWARSVTQMPANQIWSVGYYQPFWQDAIATFHSIPFALIALIICQYQGWGTASLFFLSMVLHSLLDLPVHNDDAHRHFFPFSDYRFISPFSYWDRNHYGDIVAGIEMLAVLFSSFYVFRFVSSPIGRGLLILVNLFYLIGYWTM